MDLVLAHGEVVCIDGDSRNIEVSCCAGRIWVTQPGDPNDHILEPGERMTINRKGKVAVTAMIDARFCFIAPMELRRSRLTLAPGL